MGRVSDGIGRRGKGTVMINNWQREVYPDIDSRSSIEQGYADNTAVYSIVSKDAKKFASIPRYVYDKKAMATEKQANTLFKAYSTGHRAEGKNVQLLTDLLNEPNDEQSQSEFLELVRIFYSCTGESFVWLNRGDVKEKYNSETGMLEPRSDDEINKQPVLEMIPLPTGFVGIIPEQNNVFGIAGYWLEVNGLRLPIRKQDMIHWKKPNPCFDGTTLNHLRGLSPLKPGRRTLQENKDATGASVRMFKNDGAKGVLFNESMNWEDLTEDQQSDLRELIDVHINNNDVKGAVALLTGKYNYLNLGGTSVDMDLLEGKKFTWQELCFLFDMPYEFFDSKTTFNNKEQALLSWITNTIEPASKQFDQKLNNALLPSFALQDVAYIASDCTELPEMRKSLAAMVEALSKLWMISPNRLLMMLGYEPEENELFNQPWVPDGYTPLSELGSDNYQDIIDKLKAKGLNY